MARITIRGADGGVLGWFDSDSATRYDENTVHNGYDQVSAVTGTKWDHEYLYRTTAGRWVLEHTSNRTGVMDSHEYIPDGRARDWLILNDHDDAIAEHFGQVEEERGPGRPEIGKPVNVRLGDLLDQVDAEADRAGQTRAEMVRTLVAEALRARRAMATEDTDATTEDGIRPWLLRRGAQLLLATLNSGQTVAVNYASKALQLLAGDDLSRDTLWSAAMRIGQAGKSVRSQRVQALSEQDSALLHEAIGHAGWVTGRPWS